MDEYETFYDRHNENLFSYIMRMTGDYDLSCDIVQESFARYFEHYGRQRHNRVLLYTIARNALYDYWRKQRYHENAHTDRYNQSQSPEDIFMVREEYRRVLAALQKLDEGERDILSLIISRDLSYREVASITGTTEANIKVKIHRVRLKLKKILHEGP